MAEWLLGQTIDQRYRVDSLLGEGGMGLVYRVTHTRLNKPLAMKVLRQENTRDPEVLARFRREAESASNIGNQHIIDISDFGELTDGSTYFVMECLDGLDLIEAIDSVDRMPEERALRIAIQICRALGAAHDAGITHRDLKPENIFLIHRDDVEDFVKVLDFGIAKVGHGPNRLTRAGEVLGTPHYMSPEQCEGEGVDHRTDIYALGVLLYEMVTGHVPHDADTMMGILTKHMYEEPIPLRVRVPHISKELETLVMRCLEKQPERRYQTMHEVLSDLDLIEAGLQPVGPDTWTIPPTRPPRPWRRGASSVYVGGLALALLMLVATIAVGALRKPEAMETQTLQAGPAPDATDLRATQPAPLLPPPMLSPLIGEDASRGPDGAQALASTPDAGAAQAKQTRRKPVRRKPRRRPKPAPERDRSILDPWN
ncbi:MAG: serine/threonine protein kinase [Myxococcales bacterium]|nr:serine/threonine protein kinase [Myxococcales bacterium]